MKYVMLASKRFKQTRNQILHMLDEGGKTYCQTENMQRKSEPEFLTFYETEGRPICKICMAEKERRETAEPDLRVIMGEKIA